MTVPEAKHALRKVKIKLYDLKLEHTFLIRQGKLYEKFIKNSEAQPAEAKLAAESPLPAVKPGG
jgi:hypothetical protein